MALKTGQKHMWGEYVVNSPWSLTKAFEDLSVRFLLAAFPLVSCFSLAVFCFLDAGCFDLETEAEALSCSATPFFEVGFFLVFSMLLASFTGVFLTDEVLSALLTELSLTAFLEVRLRDFDFSSSSSDLLSSSSLSLFGTATSSSSWETPFASESSALSSSSSSEDCFCFFPDWEVCFCFWSSLRFKLWTSVTLIHSIC